MSRPLPGPTGQSSGPGSARRLPVAVLSPEIRIGDLTGNLRRLREAIEHAVGAGARLIVAPELATCGYAFENRQEVWAGAIGRRDSAWNDLAAVLRPDTVAVIGYAERAGDRVFNSALVFSATGSHGNYRKSHLWGAEPTLFTAGDQAGAVFHTPVGRLGVAICYDNEFPEVPRRLALSGAEVLALPVNWPLVVRPAGERAPEVIQAMAAARSSRLPVVIADRREEERGLRWTGGSCVIDGDGWVQIDGDAPLLLATLTLPAPGDKSLPPANDLFADRRPDLYR